MKFNAYGKRIEVVRLSGRWAVFYLGNEGKKRPAQDIFVPADLEESEVKNYLEDILHEWAAPGNHEITVIK